MNANHLKSLRKKRDSLTKMLNEMATLGQYEAAIAVCKAAEIVHNQYQQALAEFKKTKKGILSDLGSGI